MKTSYSAFVIVFGLAHLTGCGSSSLEPATDGSATESNDSTANVPQVVVVQNADGTVTVRTVYVTQAESDAQLAEKVELTRLAAEGGTIPRRTTQVADGRGVLPKSYLPVESTSNCIASDLWLNANADNTGFRVCFRRNTGATGSIYLRDYYYYAFGSPLGNDVDMTKSWWSGMDTGGFGPTNGPGPGVTFGSYQRCGGCTISSNFAKLYFN